MAKRSILCLKSALRLKGETNRARKKQSSAIIAADVRQFGHVINKDGVLGHTARRKTSSPSSMPPSSLPWPMRGCASGLPTWARRFRRASSRRRRRSPPITRPSAKKWWPIIKAANVRRNGTASSQTFLESECWGYDDPKILS